MKHILGIAMLSIVLIGAGCAGGSADDADPKAKLILPDGSKVKVEVALTRSQQLAGLSGRENIGDGMLFCLDKLEKQSFWMLGMKVPIDMIWMHSGDVEGVAHDVPLVENGEPAIRESGELVDMVLELPAGEAAKHGVEKGTQIEGAIEACNK